MHITTIPDFFLMVINKIVRILKSESRKKSTHSITASIIINDLFVAGPVKLPSSIKANHVLNQSMFGIYSGVVETACKTGHDV